MRDKSDAITCRMTISKWRPNQVVPTYFVSAKPRKGCFTQINDAIQYAQPYSRIEVLSGVYTEAVVVSKAIEIGSEKGDEQAVVQYHQTAFVLQAAEAFIEDIAIRNTENQTAMRIERGSPRVVRCQIAGIEVINDATPFVDECKIELSAVHGISVSGTAGGMYKGNSVVACGWYGIHVETTGPATFMHNSVTECAQGQVIVRGGEDVNPVFQYNRVIDQVRQTLDPSLLHHSVAFRLEHLPVKNAGQQVVIMPVEMTTTVKAHVSEDLEDDAVNNVDPRCAIDVGSGSHPTFIRNTIVGGINNGFFIHSSARGNYEHNYVTTNRGWGFVVDGAATKAHISANSISGNGGGIKVVNAPVIVDQKNEIVENRGPHLYVINGHPDFVFTRNEIRSGTKIGILCRDGGSGLIDTNSFDQCGTCLRIEHGADPKVINNTFSQSNIGLYALRGGRGVFHENEFCNIAIMCVLLSSFAEPRFTQCRFLTSHAGVLATKGARGHFVECIIKDNKSVQVEISDRASPTFVDCFIADGRDDGVKVHNRGLGRFYRNLIAGNERSQVCIRTKGDPILEQNVITRSHYDGILVEDGGLGVLVENVVERCRLCGISIVSRSRPSVRGNIITLCREGGLHIGDGGGEGEFEKNEIFNNCRANVVISGSGVPVDPKDRPFVVTALLRANKIYNAQGVGVLVNNRAFAAIVDNLLQTNEAGAIRISHSSEVTVLRNEFVAGGDGIAAVEDSLIRICANSFSDLHGAAITADEGCKGAILWNITEHCGTGICLRNSQVVCVQNAVLQSTEAGFVLGAQCRSNVRYNAAFENATGARFESRSRGQFVHNCIFESETNGVVFDGDEIQTTMELNVILNSRSVGMLLLRGTPKPSLNLVANCNTGVHALGEHSAAQLSHVYLSCCHTGILLDANSRTKVESCLVGHCDVGIHFQRSASATVVKGTVVHNSAAAGVYASQRAAGEIADCSLFKNFINLCTTTQSTIVVNTSLLQAAVTCSGYCTSGSTPTVTRTVIASRAMSTDDDLDEAKEAERQSKIIRVNLVKRFGEAKVRDRWRPYEFFIQSLWDDLYATNSSTIGGLPRQWFPDELPPVGTTDARSDDKEASSERSNGSQSQSRSTSVYSSRPSSAGSSSRRASSATVTSVPNGDSPGGSAHTATNTVRDGDPLGTNQSGNDVGGTIVTVADILVSKAVPIARRSSILFPANLADSVDDFIGPGGPLVLHRLLGGETNSFLKGLFTYYSTGIRADGASRPLIESCLIRDHCFREMRTVSKRLPPLEARSSVLDKERAAVDMVRRSRSRSVGRRQSVAGIGGVAPQPRKPSVRHRNSVTKRREVEIRAESSLRNKDANSGDGGGANVDEADDLPAVIHLPGAPFPLERRTFLGKLLLACSPAFYLNAAAPHPKESFPELFVDDHRAATEASTSVVDGEESVLAESSVGISDVGTAFLGALREIEFLSTRNTAEFTGFGIVFAGGACGSVSKCHIIRNHVGVRILEQSNPTISANVIANQQVDGLRIHRGGQGTVRSNRIHKNKVHQIFVGGTGTCPVLSDNDVSDCASPGILVTESAAPSISSNKFSKVSSGAIIVERTGQPRLVANRISECLYGLWFRLGGLGTASGNIITRSTKHGVLVEGDDTSPQIERNTIREAKEVGIAVFGCGARPTVEMNEIASSQVTGVFLDAGAGGTFSGNLVKESVQHGIHLVGGSTGFFEGNCCRNCQGCGMLIEGNSDPFVQQNTFLLCGQYGLQSVDGAGTVTFNRILQNQIAGVSSSGVECRTTVEQNDIFENSIGVIVEGGCRSEFLDNVVANSPRGGILCKGKFTEPSLRGNLVRGNAEFGVQFTNGCSGVMEECAIILSSGNGVECTAASSPSIHACIIALHTAHGVVVTSQSSAVVSDCLVAKCNGAGCQMEDCSPHFRLKNALMLECDAGVTASIKAAGTLYNCHFFGKFRRAAVELLEYSSVVVDGCFFVDLKLGVQDAGASKLVDCLFVGCTTCAAIACPSGTSSVTATEFRECQVGLLCSKGSPKVSSCTFVLAARAGVVVTGDGSPDIDRCNFQRCRVGASLDAGGGVMQNNDVVNCGDGVVVSSDADVKQNTVYDCANSGITVRDGKPNVVGNVVYDNGNAGVMLEKGGGVLEDNKLYFARDDGALVVKPTSLTVQNRNTIKNAFSPPKEKNVAERQQMYRRQESEKEKSSPAFRKQLRALESVFTTTWSAVAAHAGKLSASCDPDIMWLFSESPASERPPRAAALGDALSVSPIVSGAPSPRHDPFGAFAQTQVPPPSDASPKLPPIRQVTGGLVTCTSVSGVEDDAHLPELKHFLSGVLDTIRPVKASESVAQAAPAPTAPKREKSRSSFSRRQSSKRSLVPQD